ncbi:MAG: hypothetical protein AVO35_01070 [Candidatus Aegiribacteria sp. MLS_C]|nr:MAG: hypothetical protein AVO35_01070 [Candidatus Aegiribacteria sp. MLS_C]
MTITARKYALLSGITPGPARMAGLYVMELVVLLSWTILMDTVLRLLSGSWFVLLPAAYLFAVILMAIMERQGGDKRENNPLEALGLGEISLDGSSPNEWQTLRRLALTPPLLLLFCVGLIPVGGRSVNILQAISGTRIVPLNESMDPRPDEEVFRTRRRALNKVIAYTMVSLMMAAVITFVPPELSRRSLEGRIEAVHGLPERERELLAQYLQMKALYPDCLEVRVRLASLYFRNDMTEDMLMELAYIRRKDPDHAILLLEQDMSVSMNDLMVYPDTAFPDSVPIIHGIPDTPSVQDTVPLQDSVTVQADPTDSAASEAVTVDSVTTGPDTAVYPSPPPVQTVPEPDTETYPDTSESQVPAEPGTTSTEDPPIPDEDVPVPAAEATYETGGSTTPEDETANAGETPSADTGGSGATTDQVPPEGP